MHTSSFGNAGTVDDEIARAVFARAGAYGMGKRMFEEGEASWPANAPIHAPVFVLIRHAREPWPREGGTTFFFVTDGIDAAFECARRAANGKDARISGGANTLRQYPAAGAIDDFSLHVAPVLLGDGIRLFEGLGPDDLAPELVEWIGRRWRHTCDCASSHNPLLRGPIAARVTLPVDASLLARCFVAPCSSRSS